MAMLKLVIIAFLIYVAYRLFASPPRLDGRRQPHLEEEEEDDEYTDYEELD